MRFLPSLAILAFLLTAPAAAQGPSLRWEDSGLGSWRPAEVAVGDNGSTVFVARIGLDAGHAVFAAGSPDPVFAVPLPYFIEDQSVAIAERAPYCAVVVSHDYRPTQGHAYRRQLRVYSTLGDGTPLWTAWLPGDHPFGAVEMSEDGQRIVAAWRNPARQKVIIRVYDLSGAVLQELRFPEFALGRTRALSADGTRFAFSTSDSVQIVDLVSGEVLRHFTAANNRSLDLSKDGKRVAFSSSGSQAWVQVHSVDSGEQLYYRYISQSVRPRNVALNAAGTRLAFQATHSGYEEATTELVDVDTGQILFSDLQSAIGTSAQLTVLDLAIDDPGRTVIGGISGDSFQTTREVVVWDESGARLAEYGAAGAGLSVDLGPDGEVWAAGCAFGHPNTGIFDGVLAVGDSGAAEIAVLGQPRVRQDATLRIADGWVFARVFVATALGETVTPVGSLALDQAALAHVLRLPVPPGGLDLPIHGPQDPLLAGTAYHFQALLTGPGATRISNKVSTRVLP